LSEEFDGYRRWGVGWIELAACAQEAGPLSASVRTIRSREGSCFTERQIQALVANPRVIRNRMKLAGAAQNARALLKVHDEFGKFDAYCWRFVDGRPKVNRWRAMRQIPATSRESEAFSKDLKHRGFSFVGRRSSTRTCRRSA